MNYQVFDESKIKYVSKKFGENADFIEGRSYSDENSLPRVIVSGNEVGDIMSCFNQIKSYLCLKGLEGKTNANGLGKSNFIGIANFSKDLGRFNFTLSSAIKKDIGVRDSLQSITIISGNEGNKEVNQDYKGEKVKFSGISEKKKRDYFNKKIN